MHEFGEAGLGRRIIRRKARNDPDMPHPLALLRSRRQRARHCAAKQRYEIAPSKLIKLHPLPPSQDDSIADWRASSQGLAALRKLSSTYVGLGVKSYKSQDEHISSGLPS
jgi:hypothetical protein